MFKANIEETSLIYFSVFITTVNIATRSMLGSRNFPEGRGLDRVEVIWPAFDSKSYLGLSQDGLY